MSKELEVRRGSGNVFRDHGDPNAETNKLKAQLAAEIISILNRRKLSVRAAAKLVGIDHSDVVKIRNADLARFTIDRLVRVLTRLDHRVEIKVSKSRARVAA